MSKSLVIKLGFCFLVQVPSPSCSPSLPQTWWVSCSQSLWHNKEWTLQNPYPHCEVLLYHNCGFVRKADQQRLMRSVNFSCPCCIGNTSAPLHLSLRSWLLKVDSKHRLCWLSACLYIRTQIVGELTACCCQSNKSCPPWPHSLVYAGELWTAMSFIWCVCHLHFLSQVPPLGWPPCVPPPPIIHVFFPHQKEILSQITLFPFVTFYAFCFCWVPLWVLFRIAINDTDPSPHFFSP